MGLHQVRENAVVATAYGGIGTLVDHAVLHAYICRHVTTLSPSELLSLSSAAGALRLEDPVLCPLIEQQVHHHMNSSSYDPGQISKVLEGMVKGKHCPSGD